MQGGSAQKEYIFQAGGNMKGRGFYEPRKRQGKPPFNKVIYPWRYKQIFPPTVVLWGGLMDTP